MKTLTLIVALIAINLTAHTQDDKYTKIMKSSIAKLDTAELQSTWIKAANKFERVASAEKDKWQPYYWSAYCNIVQVYMEKDKEKIDSHLDKADKLIHLADSLSPKNSEIVALQGWSYGARIAVDPMTRGMKYGPMSGKKYEEAKILNPENPRCYYLSGVATLFTPEMFGGGKEKAKPILEEALEKFKVFEPATEVDPDWGEEQCVKMLERASTDKEEKK